jgi:hypothetical protein
MYDYEKQSIVMGANSRNGHKETVPVVADNQVQREEIDVLHSSVIIHNTLCC